MTDVEAGGATVFPRIDIRVLPKKVSLFPNIDTIVLPKNVHVSVLRKMIVRLPLPKVKIIPQCVP